MNTPYRSGDELPSGAVVLSIFDTAAGQALAMCAHQRDIRRTYQVAIVDAQGNASPERSFADFDEAFDVFLSHLKRLSRD